MVDCFTLRRDTNFFAACGKFFKTSAFERSLDWDAASPLLVCRWLLLLLLKQRSEEDLGSCVAVVLEKWPPIIGLAT